ncbi:uncharacterized protein LOC117645736 [Thrips palmi]|uniref:Uncharacterized protein LOC117645736 n=1 Tax=Thrips palmi TaxID=161013 RepID=A0A6P8Z5S2_THRPL|nr:uncharacterized protein LOC117645736 [Thrips palmi]
MPAVSVVSVLAPVVLAALTAVAGVAPGELPPSPPGSPSGPLRLRKRYDLDLQTCVENFDVQRDQIIRTQDSKRMGAVNLAVKDVLTREECLRLCCETDKCDVFVFEEKQSPGTCYMFHCGPPGDSRCKFTRHESYSTGILDTTRRILDQHEQDLNSLRSLLEPTPSPLLASRLLAAKTGPILVAPAQAAAPAVLTSQGERQKKNCVDQIGFLGVVFVSRSSTPRALPRAPECIAASAACSGVAPQVKQ